MTQIKVNIDHAEAKAELTGILTTRMVGIPVKFTFGPVWDGLIKAAVFQGSGASIVVMLLRTDEVCVPYEVLECAGSTLRIGVEGRSSDGELVIPSTMVEVGRIVEGADPHGTEPTEPTQPVWAQIMAAIESGALKGDKGDPGEDGVSPTVTVTEIPGGHRISITDAAGTQSFDVPAGVGGVVVVDDLETAEPTWALSANMGKVLRVKIENDLLTVQKELESQIEGLDANRVKNVNGIYPDGNGEVTLDIPTEADINTLIDAKLGVIENGTY